MLIYYHNLKLQLQENIQGQQEFFDALTKQCQDLDSLKQHIQKKAEEYTRKAQK